ncbi:MAG: type III pantothenate kinase [Acidimicrobiia bacterium]|nr:type III pantothenate kinase [Acidimicrobiia bacterium]
MLLAIDVGNTQTVIGLFGTEAGQPPVGTGAERDLLDHWRIATSAQRTSDELALLVQEFLGFHGFSFDEDVSGVALCSSVPSITAAVREMTRRYFGFEAVVVEPGVKTGMPILYENPKEVGADRIADAVAAFDLFGGPTIVVDFGTATTLEAISAEGEYLGGAIIPGVEISMEALFSRAAALRKVELIEPRNVIGKNTIESIQSGALYGFGGQVDAIARRIVHEIGEATVVATGGLAAVIAPYSEMITEHEPWLTLHGLRLIYEKNQR